MDESSGYELAFLMIIVLATLFYLMPGSLFTSNIMYIVALMGAVYTLRGTWAWITTRHVKLDEWWIVFMLMVPFIIWFGGLGLFLNVLGNLVSVILTVVFAVVGGLFNVVTAIH